MTNTAMSTWARLLGAVLSLVVLASACGDDADSAGGLGFCALAAEQDELAADFSFSAGPEDVESFYREQRRLTAAGVAAAPNPQVREDLETLARGIDGVIAALEGVGWDFSALDDAAMASFDSPEFEAAADRVDAYAAAECGTGAADGLADDGGLDDGTIGADDLPDLGDGDVPEFMIDALQQSTDLSEEQIRCLLGGFEGDFFEAFSNIDPSNPDAINPLLEVYERCGLSPDDFG